MNCDRVCSRVIQGAVNWSSVSRVMAFLISLLEYCVYDLCPPLLREIKKTTFQKLVFEYRAGTSPAPTKILCFLHKKINIGITKEISLRNSTIFSFYISLKKAIETKSPLYNNVRSYRRSSSDCASKRTEMREGSLCRARSKHGVSAYHQNSRCAKSLNITTLLFGELNIGSTYYYKGYAL